MLYSDPESADYDSFTSLRFLQKACFALDGAACGRLALIYFDGEGDVERDWSAAAKFSQDACSKNDRDGCDVAEAIFADSNSSFFDAARALRFRKVNCNFGRWESCSQLARIIYNLGDYRNAEQIAARSCGAAGSTGPDRKEICDLAGALASRRIKLEEAEAQASARQQAAQQAERANRRGMVDLFLRKGDYDGAIYAAIYHARTVSDAEYALSATIRGGAIGSVYLEHLYILDNWIASGNLNQIVNAEIARRSKGNDCGIYNCTNTPGASSARWAAANGGRSSSGYRPPSSSAPEVKYGLSSAEARQQTREKYRSAHCTMTNNANRYACQ
ncbi:hypothetical protein IP79_11030 [Porphyrobacter sp. AAP60]|nr:hypothetical protein IP79_11030 [Porphyrobacter sp. AAP60]